jgi:hypothetical protein
MARRDDIPKTDTSKIEALIQRLKHSNIEPRDAQVNRGRNAHDSKFISIQAFGYGWSILWLI